MNFFMLVGKLLELNNEKNQVRLEINSGDVFAINVPNTIMEKIIGLKAHMISIRGLLRNDSSLGIMLDADRVMIIGDEN